jgi:prevent-host-death family protein
VASPDARESLADVVASAQEEPICITRHGKPVAIIAGIEGVDLGSVILEGRPEICAVSHMGSDPNPDRQARRLPRCLARVLGGAFLGVGILTEGFAVGRLVFAGSVDV